MRSDLEIEDFLYDVPEIIEKWLEDRLFQEDLDKENENWIYYTREKNGVVRFIVNKGNTKAQNSVYLSSGPDTINVTNSLSNTQKERIERLLRLTMEGDYDDYCFAKVKYMIEHHRFERLDNDERFSTLINLTNAFIELKNILEKVNDEEGILNLFDYNPLKRLEELEKEIEERSFVPDFKNKL